MHSFTSRMLRAVAGATLVAVSCAATVALAQPAAVSQPASQQSAPTMTGKEALAKAASEKKYTFVFFYKPGGAIAGLTGKDTSAQTAQMRPVFDAAMQKMADKALAAAVNVSDPKEKEIVKQFGVDRAPMPLVLAVAPNGAVTGGFPTKFTEEQLQNAFATPGMQECLKHLQSRKLVFLCFQNSKTKSNEAANKGVNEFKADPKFGQATEIVRVDPSDKAEQKLAADFKVDPKTPEAVTVFLAPPGSPLAVYTGATDKNAMVTKLTSAMSSCGSGCGPGGCGPK